METEIIQQEILLFTDTGFSQREFSEKLESQDNRSHLSEKEKLQDACWNGLLSDMLPEIVSNKNLFIWKVQEANAFLSVDLSEQPFTANAAFSIDPYLFLPTAKNN